MLLERRRQRDMTNHRKRESREKMIFDGLIIKAGLRKADRAFLLGALIEASRIPPDTAQYRELHKIGMEAFRADARMNNSESKDLDV
jgi:hypothetical protein